MGLHSLERLNQKLEEISQIKSLTFDEYFDLVQGYRDLREIPDDEFRHSDFLHPTQ